MSHTFKFKIISLLHSSFTQGGCGTLNIQSVKFVTAVRLIVIWIKTLFSMAHIPLYGIYCYLGLVSKWINHKHLKQQWYPVCDYYAV